MLALIELKVCVSCLWSKLKEVKQMNRKHGISAICSAIMLIIAMVMPAAACVPGAFAMNDSIMDDLDIESEEGFSQLNSLLQVRLNNDAKIAIQDLESKGYILKYGQADVQKINLKDSKEDKTIIVEIPAKKKNSDNIAKLIFISGGNKTIVGNMITEYGEDYIRTDVLETTNGIEKRSVLENHAGVISIDGTPIIAADGTFIPTDAQIAGNIECNTCMTVCEYLYAGGCGLTALGTCTVGCAVFTGPAAVACPAICTLLFALMCVYGTNKNCPYLCSEYC